MMSPVKSRDMPVPILYVHHGLDWITGSERCLLDLIERVDRTRFTPIVWCDAPALLDAASKLGATVYRSPDWGENSSLFPRGENVRAARELIRRHGIGLIHSNDTAPLRALIPAARSERVPLLAHLHLRLTEMNRRWAWLHQVSLAVGVSEAAVRGLREDGLSPRHIAVIYNGVDQVRLGAGDARTLRADLGIQPGEVVFTVVGSLIERKGVDVALRAFRQLSVVRTDCQLLVCGDGPLDDELRALAGTLGIARRVHFLGRRDDVGAVLRDATDVLVTAARNEALPLNVLEAAVLGRTIVASTIEPHAEIITDGEDGLLFPTDDATALATVMEQIASDSGLRQRLGDAARERAERSFLISRYVTEFEQAYETLLESPRSAYGWTHAWNWPATYTTWVRETLGRRLWRLLNVTHPPPPDVLT